MSLNSIIHFIINLSIKKDWKDFKSPVKGLKDAQLEVLSSILKSLPKFHHCCGAKEYSDLNALPETDYTNWISFIDKNSSTSSIAGIVKRYQPTSGSTDLIKWIPYNESIIISFNKAINPWLYDIYRSFPGTKKGTHYWSLSWLPSKYRENINLDDSEFLSPFKKFFYQKILAVPKSCSEAETLDQSLIQTAAHLVLAEDLSLISIWSPTFLISLMDTMIERKEEVHRYMDSIGKKRLIKYNKKEELHLLWPMLSLISCWDTSTSTVYAERLKVLFPQTNFQGKGLWTTEAVITIPFEGRYLLSYRTHFYEFKKENKTIIPSWELKVGEIVTALVTTQNGFIRYKINDSLLVEGFIGEIPILKFLGRKKESDLVGEKISNDMVSSLFENRDQFNALIGIISPLKNKIPYYIHLTDGDNIEIESELLKAFHFKLARELGQLGETLYFRSSKAQHLYQKICRQKGMVEGNIKLEYLIQNEDDAFIYE